MQHLSTAFLIIALVIAVNQGGATAQDDTQPDQIADETKNRAVTIIDGPKYVEPPTGIPQTNQSQPEPRPPSKPPHPAPDKILHQPIAEPSFRPYHGPGRDHGPRQKGPAPVHVYQKVRHNSVYRVIPVSHHRNYHYVRQSTRQPLAFAASTGRPVRVPLNSNFKPPKFSVPIETINGIRTDVVRPPKEFANLTTAPTVLMAPLAPVAPMSPVAHGPPTTRQRSTERPTTTTKTTTTHRPLRNKRIWPKRYLEKKKLILQNTTTNNTSQSIVNSTSTNNSNSSTGTDLEIASATHYRFRYVNTNRTAHSTTTFVPLTITRGYRRVHRVPSHSTTAAYDTSTNYTRIASNDWVPIIPSHYSNNRRRRPKREISRRSDDDTQVEFTSPEESPNPDESKRTIYLQYHGLVPMAGQPHALANNVRKKMVLFRKRKRAPSAANAPMYSGYSPKPGVRPVPHVPYFAGDLNTDASQLPVAPTRVITRIKHHHHHHHHRYIKTVEKPVKIPYKVEVPRPYPVTIEKKVPIAVEKIKFVEKPVPYPVQVEKRVPFPVQVQVPHPVPYKVIEKEYVPKPYPVHVPVVKHVEVKVPQPVPVPVEKRIPYPVEVQVPVPVYHPYPVNVTVEKKVPYPVPVRVLVPQPYPVETRVPYPVEVKVREPVEVVKHVPVKVPYPQPYPVKVPTPVAIPVETRVPYPVEVEKKVPVPYKVIVPQKVEVEKKVPVYVPQPFAVEKKVPHVKETYPVNAPYNDVPVYLNQPYQYNYNDNSFQYSVSPAASTLSNSVTSTPHHTVTVHGNTGFAGFQSRSDKTETTSAESSEAPSETTSKTTMTAKQEDVTSVATTTAS